MAFTIVVTTQKQPDVALFTFTWEVPPTDEQLEEQLLITNADKIRYDGLNIGVAAAHGIGMLRDGDREYIDLSRGLRLIKK